MLVSKCYLRDIREWEENNNKNLSSLLNRMSMSNLFEMVSLFNKNMSEDEVWAKLDNYFENNSIFDAFEEIRNKLFVNSESKQKDVDIDIEDTGAYEDITQYETLTDFYMHLCMQLMSLGVTYSEFWSLTTTEMYQVFEAIQQKTILDFNRQMQVAYIQAGLTGSAIWGKLPKEAPKVEDNSNEDKWIDTEYGEMTLADYKAVKELEKL